MEVLGLFNIPIWAIILVTAIVLYHLYSSKNFGVFHEMGVKGPRPWPVIGNIGITKGFIEGNEEWFKTYGRVFGIHEGMHPLLMVGDCDMLKEITVKEFNNFVNRRDFGIHEVGGPPMSDFLTIQKDDDWRHNRNTLTPTFSGGKMKKMTDVILESGKCLVKALKLKADSGEPLDMKIYTGSFTMDVIAATGFGIKLDTQATPDDPFIKYARKFFDFSVFSLSSIILLFFPFMNKLIKYFKLPLTPTDSVEFFSKIINQALAERRSNPGKYVDFLQLMINAEAQAHGSAGTDSGHAGESTANGDGTVWKDKKKGKGLTDSEILANSIIFFAAGYDTTASTMAHLFYHLAMNQDCMDRLIEEIDQHFPDGELPDYESVNNLPYLEMVITEGLRINPPVARMDRICNKETTINGITIPVGMGVALPVYMIHHDPAYWPDPETFNPERFTPERRQKHHPLQWIPFGSGPRNCIGMRLALFEMKMAIIMMLQKYRFVPNHKTKPMRFGQTQLLSNTKDGIWLTVIERNKGFPLTCMAENTQR